MDHFYSVDFRTKVDQFSPVVDMQNTGDVAQLKRSINIEIVLACVLLLITSVLTSVVGPEFS